jgi:ornithine carbamoyltransferase
MNFLSMSDLTPEGLRDLLALANEVKTEPTAFGTRLSGQSVGLFFAKQSLRTWVSCEVATAQLGGHPLALSDETIGLGSREAPADVGRVLERYIDLLAMRVYRHEDLTSIAQAVQMPMVNLLSDREHPCQAVADLQTIAAHRPLAGAAVTYVGDGNNVCHSLMLGATMTGASVRVAAPPGYQPDPLVIEAARAHGDVEVFAEPEPAVEGCDVVYTDVWTSMGQEAESEVRRRIFAPFQVNTDLFDRAKSGAIFMHCLPAHRGEEVTDEIMEHKRSVVFDQAENRLHAFKAVLLTLLDQNTRREA